MMHQDNFSTEFTNRLIAQDKLVTVFLTNGVRLTGYITAAHQDGTLLLERDGVTQLVRGHAVATIMPQEDYGITRNG